MRVTVGHVEREEAEWDRMWESLASLGMNQGLEQPTVAPHPDSGECWQYMGSCRSGRGGWRHEFRHRMHPTTNQREYYPIAASRGWKPETTHTYN